MTTLPTELWEQITSYITDTDIKESSGVCKRWNTSLAGFRGTSISIKIYICQFDELLEDFKKYPSFILKIDKLTIQSKVTMHEDTILLRNVLHRCINLLVLEFTQKYIHRFLRMLNSSDTMLPSIQELDIANLTESPPSTRKFYIYINYRFRSTITTLQLTGIESNEALHRYGGLIGYTSRFPSLKNLEISGNCQNDQTLDLNQLLAANLGLETLNIAYIPVKGDLVDLPPSSKVIYSSLKSLYLCGFSSDITIVEYILTRFTNLDYFKVADVYIDQCEAVPGKAADAMIKDFNTVSAKLFHLYYVYKNSFNTRHTYMCGFIKDDDDDDSSNEYNDLYP